MRWGVWLFALTALGCQQVADERAEFGPEVSRAEVNRALARATAGARVDAARVGTSVAYRSVRQVGDGGGEVDLGTTDVTVTADATVDSRRTLRLRVDRNLRGEGGAFKASHEEETLTLDLVRASAAAPDAGGARVTYHRLRTATETLAAPAAVRARPECGGLNRCELRVNYVIFDLVARPTDGGESRKVTLTLGFSAETPYLPHGSGLERFDGALVLECRTSFVRVDARSVSVRDCRQLSDFTR